MLLLPLACLAFIGFASPILAQSGFAHVIVGNTYSYTQASWASDIAAATAAGIDGFALNIAYADTINSNGYVQAYVTAPDGRPYMMPVSPWFYTNLPLWSKNWLWRGDDLWHDRWDQVLDEQPAFVEILTWNDWGESHYIGPIPPTDSAIPDGAGPYVMNNPHDAWLKDLPHYIAAYKNTSRPDESHITFWYRLNPASGSACGAGTTCNTPTQGQVALSTQECDIDAVFFTAFVPDTAVATVNVTIGGSTQTVSAGTPGIFHSNVPFADLTGDVTVSVTTSDGTETGPVNGAPISTDCPGGNVNWNAWVGGS
ncbi:murein transglycosylase [Cladophialophora psammophila CBS 110553]|uniref:Murein transglycosylase n=1 Tax=Cladophialophora psammophila CBS 110553 TaxID=1182543 RepID=W9WPE6_9EURO|nr:murein transglycosylase [Cladophialophora psammophila CBS 110553]EXJ70062.1 murein transglycosylase [Cladophialophora psammophila CBS 110553]